MNLIVIHEKDHSDNEKDVIGVADSVENAELLIDEYYGKDNYKVIKFNDIRDSNLEYSKVIELEFNNTTYKYTITLQWFKLNES